MLPLVHPISIPCPLRFIEDQDIVIRESAASACLQVEVVPSPDEDGTAENMLENLHERIVTRVEHCSSGIMGAVFVDELESD